MCLKLSNSGDILKLMIPSYSRKVISGQINYLGMVTSHKMSENEMDYRGSKSEYLMDSVKEQRVDGSWLLKLAVLIRSLRYTLMGFERNYQIKVLSKQFNKTNFCTSVYAQVPFTKLDQWFGTGFCDGDASIYLMLKFIKKRTLHYFYF